MPHVSRGRVVVLRAEIRNTFFRWKVKKKREKKEFVISRFGVFDATNKIEGAHMSHKKIFVSRP